MSIVILSPARENRDSGERRGRGVCVGRDLGRAEKTVAIDFGEKTLPYLLNVYSQSTRKIEFFCTISPI